ncbi:MAG: hypothetical protein WKF82_05970 [Nocardioidaceae bacterium]
MHQSPDSRVSIPKARRFEKVRERHGHRRVDGYAWLRNVDDPEVVAHLEAERSFYEASTAHLRSLVEALTNDMAARVPETDSSVSYRRQRLSYYTRTPTGSEYAQLWRGGDIPEAVGETPAPGDLRKPLARRRHQVTGCCSTPRR